MVRSEADQLVKKIALVSARREEKEKSQQMKRKERRWKSEESERDEGIT